MMQITNLIKELFAILIVCNCNVLLKALRTNGLPCLVLSINHGPQNADSCLMLKGGFIFIHLGCSISSSRKLLLLTASISGLRGIGRKTNRK